MHKGIPKYLEQYDMKYEDLGIKGTTLVYRRNIENMPLTTIPEDASPEMVEKRKLARRKILNNTLDKFLFKVAECTQPVGLSYENNILNGIDNLIELDNIENEILINEFKNKLEKDL